MQKYRQLKDILRSHFVKKPTASPKPDIEKIREQVRQKLTKKTCRIQLNFEGKNTKLSQKSR